MPNYNTQPGPPALFPQFPENTYLVFSAETLVAGKFSQQVSLPLGPTAGAKGLRVEIDFSVNPGTFEIDILEADNDTATTNPQQEYQQVPTGGQINSVTSGPNGASTHQSTGLIPIAGQFACAFVRTAPSNACTCTVRFTRAA